MTENAFAFAASAMIPIGQASTAGNLTFKSTATIVAKEGISMGAGAGAQKITTDVTGNDTAGMVAGMVASGVTAKGLNGIEAEANKLAKATKGIDGVTEGAGNLAEDVGKAGKGLEGAAEGAESAAEDAGKVVESCSKADVLAQNRANGRAFEQQEFAKFSSQNNNAVEQITVKTSSGVKTRVDAIGLDANGNVVINEYKSSLTAPLTSNQKIAFPEIFESGATVVGKGKGIFSGGYQIPPGTKVTIIRPE